MEGKTRTRERRRTERIASDAVRVTIHDVGSARPTVLPGQIVDVSDRGMGILTQNKIQDRTSVSVRVEPWDWSGNGSIRYCSQRGLKFLVGLELAPGTRRPVTAERPADSSQNQ